MSSQTSSPNCRQAIGRAYARMIELGMGEEEAFATALRIYRHYHPEADRTVALDTVAAWLDQDPPPGASPH